MRKVWQRITDWEQWPFILIYSPLVFLWIYYAIRARAIWYFSPVNPQLEFSGFEGEGKREMYDLMPQQSYPTTIYIKPGLPFDELLRLVSNAGLSYPMVVKPDKGMQGILFRILHTSHDLKNYHKMMPVEYVVQRFVDLPLEFSAFHIRYPGQTKGKLTGFIQKQYLSVTGDGRSDLLTLIQQHPKAKLREADLRKKHAARLTEVLPAGETYYLSFAGNHNQGATFINLYNEIDDRLRLLFDTLSNECKTFYYGRYDLKCASLSDLKEGKNFYVLEFNGTGAEPNHIYDCNLSYFGALKEIARHWRDMYLIGRINHKQGVPYWSFRKGLAYLLNARKFFGMLRTFDIGHSNH